MTYACADHYPGIAGGREVHAKEEQVSASEDRQLEAEADAHQADADERRRVDAIVMTDRRVVALVEAVFSADANKGAGFDTLASADWDAVLDHARGLIWRWSGTRGEKSP